MPVFLVLSVGTSTLLCVISVEDTVDGNVCCRLGNNLAGQYKRGMGMALQIGIGNFGGAIASNVFRSQDSPRFVIGRV
jgi:hypothetical protein